jgi:RHS repeat-associated protein
VGNITFKQSGTTRMTETRQYDNLNRLLQTTSSPTADSAISFGYQYNDANERTHVDTSYPAAPSHWAFDYDKLGQVTSGKRFWTDNTPVAGQQFEYAYDEIGNRVQTKSGGDGSGGNLRVAGYTNNSLNQLTSRGVPGTIDVIGTALSTASVTVNGQAASGKGAYFDAVVPVSNGTTNVYQAITNVISDGVTTFTTNGNIFVPHNAEVMGYDLDGNMTNDGRWILTWDGENRLIRMTSTNVVDAAKKTVVFSYDWRGRRMSKTVSNWVSGAWQVGNSERYIYDNWNLFAIFPASSPTWKMSYTWGPDLSGSMRGAGGVGGLLGMRDGNNGTNYFCAYDGNGNVAGFVNANNGLLSAQYEYDPFGNVLRATGYLSQTNTVRFSSKMQDPESGWSYYGYRYYNPNYGEWVSRDPIEEEGGLGLNVWVSNDPANSYDLLGMSELWGKGRTALSSVKTPVINFNRCKCAITIVAGHTYATDEQTGKPIPGSGLYGEAALWADYQSKGLLKCAKVCFVGCHSKELNDAANAKDMGVPGIRRNIHFRNIFPGKSNEDLLYTLLLNNRIRQAIDQARIEAKRMCKANKCACSEIVISVQLELVESKYGRYSETVKCEK